MPIHNNPINNKQKIKLIMVGGCIIALLVILGGCSLISKINQLNKPTSNLDKTTQSSQSSNNKTSYSNYKYNSYYHSKPTSKNDPTSDLPNLKDVQFTYQEVKPQIGNGKYNNYGAYELNNNKSTLNAKNGNATFATNTVDTQKRPSTANAFLNKQSRQYKNRNTTNNGASTWKPNGYHQLTHLNGKYKFAYNRGHLLGYALVGNIKHYDASESNHKNIVTQTSWSNQANSSNNTGQNYYEGLVRKGLDQNKKIKYQVTPIYYQKNIVPNGMHIQAKSTDNTINFNVFIPNVQNNININYKNGIATPK